MSPAHDIIELLLGGKQDRISLRTADAFAAQAMLETTDATNAAETLMASAAMLLFSSRADDVSLSTITTMLDGLLVNGISRILDRSHSVMHRHPEERSPFAGTMLGAVVRGLHKDNIVSGFDHDDLVAFIDGPLAERIKRTQAELDFVATPADAAPEGVAH